MICTVILVAGSTGVSQAQDSAAVRQTAEPLKAFLRSYLSLWGKVSPDKTTQITAVTVKTNSGKPEDIVYVSGQDWCGSGGCTLLILEPSEATFKILGKVTIVQLPVRLLASSRNWHPDIGVTVQGGGVRVGYEAVLSFNGENYPRNPSLPPARKAAAVQGKVIIANNEGSIFLYN